MSAVLSRPDRLRQKLMQSKLLIFCTTEGIMCTAQRGGEVGGRFVDCIVVNFGTSPSELVYHA